MELTRYVCFIGCLILLGKTERVVTRRGMHLKEDKKDLILKVNKILF